MRTSVFRPLAFALAVLALEGCGGGDGGGGAGRNVLHLSIGPDPASLDPIQAVDVYPSTGGSPTFQSGPYP